MSFYPHGLERKLDINTLKSESVLDLTFSTTTKKCQKDKKVLNLNCNIYLQKSLPKTVSSIKDLYQFHKVLKEIFVLSNWVEISFRLIKSVSTLTVYRGRKISSFEIRPLQTVFSSKLLKQKSK